MKQIVQHLRDGRLEVADVPCPRPGPGQVLVRTKASLISAGTERMLVEFSRANLLQKARQQPDKVKQVLDKIRTDGLLPTLDAVFRRLDEPLPLGYCNVGEVVEVGSGVNSVSVGERVASNGPHAEYVCVPKNLCARVPDGVSDEQAAFTVLSSIGLQGLRLLTPQMGESVVVYGLGLIGLITVQLLRASGCHVTGIDVNAERLKLAERFGATVIDATGTGDVVQTARDQSGGLGVDGVVVTASASKDTIVHNSAGMCRKKGRIVLVGVVDLDLQRTDFYEKELSFQVSCSYGPGRYDESYERDGIDYPRTHVRWTAQRNFEAVLEAMRTGSVAVDDLVSHRFDLRKAQEAYDEVTGDGSGLGIVLTYPQEEVGSVQRSITILPTPGTGDNRASVAVIGAGNFTKMTLLPALARTSARIVGVADLDGAAAHHMARTHSVEKAVTDHRLLLDDPAVDAVLIAVRHDLHAPMVVECLEAGKHVFVEKPLALNKDEMLTILDAAAAHPDRHVIVGFNRRFSPHVREMKRQLGEDAGPLAVSVVVNAGDIPAEHWVHHPTIGGGRIIGEACHFIDLICHLCGSSIESVSASAMARQPSAIADTMSISLKLADGSVGTLSYFANGSKAYPKETVEVFSGGRVLRLENFRRLRGFGFRGFRGSRTSRQDKGHAAQFDTLVKRLEAGGRPLVPLAQSVNATLASFAAATSANDGRTVVLSAEYPDLATKWRED